MSSPARASRLRRPAAAALRLPGQVTLPGRPAAAGPGLVTQPHGCEPECQRHASGLEPGRRLGPANEELRLRPGPVAQQRPGPPSPCRVCRLPHWQRCCGGPSSDPSPTAPDDRARASLFLRATIQASMWRIQPRSRRPWSGSLSPTASSLPLTSACHGAAPCMGPGCSAARCHTVVHTNTNPYPSQIRLFGALVPYSRGIAWYEEEQSPV